ncbi:MAG: hypothetical protein JNM02_08590 [Anaerolineales bacterium]|nr:hypothetical protein [Anaerolineales bacterium]
MEEPVEISSDDPIIATLHFAPFRNMIKRGVTMFMPAEGEPQTKQIKTPWGTELTAKRGDMLVYELSQPDDAWPVDAEIFDASYMMLEPGICIKRVITWLVPLIDVTGGDADRLVTVHTLEGSETVRAGDFYLAKGVQGEIWPYPIEKANEIMRPAE